MIPQFGFSEMLVIAVLALIVVGPKDLPKMMRQVGRFVGSIKRLGQEFKDAIDQMGEDEELAELRKEIEELKSMGQLSNLSDEAFEEDMRALDRDLRQSVEENNAPEPVAKAKNKSSTDGKNG